ncbi:hypothetical protein D3C81_1834020 [compost metagenome]
MVVQRLGLLQAAAAQPAGQCGVSGLPAQRALDERLFAPQRLVREQEGIQRGKALAQQGTLENVGHGQPQRARAASTRSQRSMPRKIQVRAMVMIR